MQRNYVNTRQPIANNEKKPCCVCGAMRSKRWKFYVENGERVWLCTGIYDTAHRRMRTEKTIRDWNADLQKRDAERSRMRHISVESPTEAVANVPKQTPRVRVRQLDDRGFRSRTPRVSQ